MGGMIFGVFGWVPFCCCARLRFHKLLFVTYAYHRLRDRASLCLLCLQTPLVEAFCNGVG